VVDVEEPEVSARRDDWVPVERRLFGIDKRTILPALAVLAFGMVLGVVLPSVNESVDYDDPIVAGDVVDLVDGTLTFVPAEGWNRVDGSLVGEGVPESVGSKTVLVAEDASLSITTGTFDGTPDELLDQINDLNEDLQDPRGLGVAGPRQPITSDSGLTGVAETFTGLDERGVTAAFVVDVDGTPVGVEVVVRGSVETISDRLDEIAAMLDTVGLNDRASQEAGS
jgi:hypothetical protein